MFERKRLLIFCLLSGLLASCGRGQQPPASGNEPGASATERVSEGSGTFALVQHAQPVFKIFLADPSDEIEKTAAFDFQRYLEERWGITPHTTQHPNLDENLIVFATNTSPLPASLKERLRKVKLGPQGFTLQRLSTGSHSALVITGGSSLGTRYGSIEILRSMKTTPHDALFTGDLVQDQPRFSWRAVYINDSNHQFNNYDPNLICAASTNRWSSEEWHRYIDQIAFQRYDVLQIWIVPDMFTPAALRGGGIYDYFRDTIRDVANYARPRGIAVSLLNGINSSVDAGTLLSTVKSYEGEPKYRYLSPSKPAELSLMLQLWDYWSKQLPEVKMWAMFPGDPGSCTEDGCGPETYVDLSIRIGKIIKKNNPGAQIDFTVWQFFGWGPTWATQMRRDSARIDRGFQYLLAHLQDFPQGTICGININEFTGAPIVADGGYGGGSAVQYIDKIGATHLIHTWTPSVTEGEGWINHHDRVPGILVARQAEARYPIAGGICDTMTPALNFLNQFACSEAYWNPNFTESQIMERYVEGAFGSTSPDLIRIFPWFNVAPAVGYTFEKGHVWHVDYERIRKEMTDAQAALEALRMPYKSRFPMLWSSERYVAELLYFCHLYEENTTLGLEVERARQILSEQQDFANRPPQDLTMQDAKRELANSHLGPAAQTELAALVAKIQDADVPAMKERFVKKHYQIFRDCPSEFTALLPELVNGFFNAFGADFVAWGKN